MCQLHARIGDVPAAKDGIYIYIYKAYIEEEQTREIERCESSQNVGFNFEYNACLRAYFFLLLLLLASSICNRPPLSFSLFSLFFIIRLGYATIQNFLLFFFVFV